MAHHGSDKKVTRRGFVKGSVLASAGAVWAAGTASRSAVAQTTASASIPLSPLPAPKATLPMGRIGDHQFSRLMLGGNLIGGYAHSRDLAYVSDLMRRYNTDAKIIETLELAEVHGINVVNSWVRDGISQLQQHWKRGGKMKWISQARVNANGNLDQFKQAADLGAAAIHVTGDVADDLVRQGKMETIVRILELVRSRKCAAGVGAHGLHTIVECEKAKINPDFYVKTYHSHDYHTAPKGDDTGDLGRYDNSWCKDPEEVAEVMHGVKQPWIAFKVLAAGAIPPQRGFQYAFAGGADFVLAGMFDWQIAEDVQIANNVLAKVQRTRPWRS
jgi:hypothetical protein